MPISATLVQSCRACLNEIKSNGGITDLTLSLNAMASQKVVLIGDTIIDEYQYVVPQGKIAERKI